MERVNAPEFKDVAIAASIRNIPNFVEKPKPEIKSDPIKFNYQDPDLIEQVLDEEYQDMLEGFERLKRNFVEHRSEVKKEFSDTYNKLCSKFLDELPKGKNIKIELLHVHSCPTNYSCIEHAILSKYQLLAVEKFIYELKERKYKCNHKEIVDYRNNPDKDDYYDYCDCYYIVEIFLE